MPYENNLPLYSSRGGGFGTRMFTADADGGNLRIIPLQLHVALHLDKRQPTAESVSYTFSTFRTSRNRKIGRAKIFSKKVLDKRKSIPIIALNNKDYISPTGDGVNK